MDADELDRRILLAHAAGNSHRLAELYYEASRYQSSQNEEPAAAFLLTQAYVFALESGHPIAGDLREQLVAMGREEN